MKRAVRPGALAGLAAGLVTLVIPPAAPAQQRCDLRITAPIRSSVGQPGGQGAYTTYLGGGTVTLRCGGAVMSGDSAVHHETEERAEMIGGVDYRDTTRTLSADRLTYYEPTGQVVATGEVELVRLSTGARLSGPRVSFLRAGAGGAPGRTLASGRPHMTVPPERGAGEPIEVDADEAEFIGETVAIARGDVEIGRSDFDATADSARFEAETARLYGRSEVTARGMRMTGDSIHAGLAGGGLDWLHAFGAARGEGEAVELEAREIRVDWSGDEVSRIEAFGGDRALAAAETFLVAGDSLDVAFTGGEPDSVTSVGAARSYQLPDDRQVDGPLVEPGPVLSEDTSWIEGDTIRAWFEARGAAPAPVGEPATSARIQRLRALANARSYFSAVRDTARSERPSRNYLIGRTIDIRFADGEPVEVTAEQSIGVFLEPSDARPPEGADDAGPAAANEGPPESP